MNNNIYSLLQGLMQNPMQTLMNANFNVPDNIANNPQAIVQHLLSSGQITQSQVNAAMQAKNNPLFRGMFG